MAISWPNVSTVGVGEIITSRQRNALADAFNVRLRSGLGDGTFRLWWKVYALMRELRAPEGFDYPAQDEWLSDYMHVAPGVGGPGGNLNYFAPLPMFVFGESSSNIDAEDVLLNSIATSGSVDPVEQWGTGKAQRGAAAPSGAFNSPVLLAANRARNFGGWGPNTAKVFSAWGGFLGAEYRGCQDGRVEQVYQFRNLVAGTAGNVIYSACDYPFMQVEHRPDRYRVYILNQSTNQWNTTDLFYTDYILFPQSGSASPGNTTGTQFREALNWFISSFRGSESQRADDDFSISEIGFDFEKFFSRQYRLAPAKAYLFGGGLVAEYTLFTLDASAAELPRLTKAVHGEYFEFDSYDFTGYCFAGYKLTATGLTAPVTLELFNKTTGVPLSENGSITVSNGASVYWFEDALSFNLEIVAMTAINAGAFITIEVAPLECKKPNLLDAYVVLRRGSCKSGGADTIGQNYNQAKAIGDNYFACGAIVNSDSASAPTNISENPLYETIRRTIRANHRLLKRDNFASYTTEGGKAVIMFNRLTGSGLEIFDGLLPPQTPIPSGQIQSNVEYKVRGNTGGVSYNGTDYAPGSLFAGFSGVKSYLSTGDAAPHQINGIITSAPEGGHTNEWTMFMSFNTYTAVDLAVEDYGDPIGFLINRCHIYSSVINVNANEPIGAFARMGDAAWGNGSPTLTPKIPSAYNYVYGANATLSTDFFKSCPLYPVDYVVERAEMDEATGFAKITLSSPLRSSDGLSRSDDNALTDYINYVQGAFVPVRIGDASAGAFLTRGSAHPRFYFTRMIRKVHVDEPIDNDTTEATDTRCLAEDMQWMHWCLDEMAPGYIDPLSLAQNSGGCAPFAGSYIYERLNMAAYGDRWPTLVKPSLRPDNAQSFGPTPMMILYTEHFNQLAQSVNLLRRIPIILPLPIQYRVQQLVMTIPAPNYARVGQFMRGQFGSPSEIASYGSLAGATTHYDSWSDPASDQGVNAEWKDSAIAGVSAGYSINGDYTIGEGRHVRGPLSWVYAPGPTCFPLDALPLQPPKMVVTRLRAFFRIHPAAPQNNALSEVLKQLLAENRGTFSILSSHTASWSVNDPGDLSLPFPQCHDTTYDMTGTGAGTVRLRSHELLNEYECLSSIPVTSAFYSGGGDGLEVETKPGPPNSYLTTMVSTPPGIGCGACGSGAGTTTAVRTLGHATVLIPSE